MSSTKPEGGWNYEVGIAPLVGAGLHQQGKVSVVVKQDILGQDATTKTPYCMYQFNFFSADGSWWQICFGFNGFWDFSIFYFPPNMNGSWQATGKPLTQWRSRYMKAGCEIDLYWDAVSNGKELTIAGFYCDIRDGQGGDRFVFYPSDLPNVPAASYVLDLTTSSPYGIDQPTCRGEFNIVAVGGGTTFMATQGAGRIAYTNLPQTQTDFVQTGENSNIAYAPASPVVMSVPAHIWRMIQSVEQRFGLSSPGAYVVPNSWAQDFSVAQSLEPT